MSAFAKIIELEPPAARSARTQPEARRIRRIASVLFLALVAAATLPLFAAAPARAVGISQPPNVSLAAIPGSGGGTSQGTATWTVTGVNLLGYTLAVHASSVPAMRNTANTSYSIPDFTTSVANTPQAWSVPANAAAFGFSAQGPDTSTSTWGTPSAGTGKYLGFNGTTDIQIANGSIISLGNSTTVYFRVQVGSSVLQPSGNYSATITATATALL